MEKKLLQKGDIIRLEEGMTIYADVPAKFVFRNKPLADHVAKTLVKIGEKFQRDEVNKKEIEDKIAEFFYNLGAKEEDYSFALDLKPDLSQQFFDTSIFEGEYVVNEVNCEGGGTCNGVNGPDKYPNGHHVFCVKKDNSEIKVDFYQTGCFTAMIEDIEPIGHEG